MPAVAAKLRYLIRKHVWKDAVPWRIAGRLAHGLRRSTHPIPIAPARFLVACQNRWFVVRCSLSQSSYGSVALGQLETFGGEMRRIVKPRMSLVSGPRY